MLSPSAVATSFPALAAIVAAPLVVSQLQSGIGGTDHTPEVHVIARIGDREITDREVDHAIRLRLYESRNGSRKEWLDRQVIETEAAEEVLDVRTFVQQRVYAGIEEDRFPNNDKWLQHLTSIVKRSLGSSVAPLILTRLVKRGEKTICIVDCPGSPKPVYVREKSGEEQFFVRTGPGVEKLSFSTALEYIPEHFPKS